MPPPNNKDAPRSTGRVEQFIKRRRRGTFGSNNGRSPPLPLVLNLQETTTTRSSGLEFPELPLARKENSSTSSSSPLAVSRHPTTRTTRKTGKVRPDDDSSVEDSSIEESSTSSDDDDPQLLVRNLTRNATKRSAVESSKDNDKVGEQSFLNDNQASSSLTSSSTFDGRHLKAESTTTTNTNTSTRPADYVKVVDATQSSQNNNKQEIKTQRDDQITPVPKASDAVLKKKQAPDKKKPLNKMIHTDANEGIIESSAKIPQHQKASSVEDTDISDLTLQSRSGKNASETNNPSTQSKKTVSVEGKGPAAARIIGTSVEEHLKQSKSSERQDSSRLLDPTMTAADANNEETASWSCPDCTLQNENRLRRCIVCKCRRPIIQGSGDTANVMSSQRSDASSKTSTCSSTGKRKSVAPSKKQPTTKTLANDAFTSKKQNSTKQKRQRSTTGPKDSTPPAKKKAKITPDQEKHAKNSPTPNSYSTRPAAAASTVKLPATISGGGGNVPPQDRAKPPRVDSKPVSKEKEPSMTAVKQPHVPAEELGDKGTVESLRAENKRLQQRVANLESEISNIRKSCLEQANASPQILWEDFQRLVSEFESRNAASVQQFKNSLFSKSPASSHVSTSVQDPGADTLFEHDIHTSVEDCACEMSASIENRSGDSSPRVCQNSSKNSAQKDITNEDISKNDAFPSMKTNYLLKGPSQEVVQVGVDQATSAFCQSVKGTPPTIQNYPSSQHREEDSTVQSQDEATDLQAGSPSNSMSQHSTQTMDPLASQASNGRIFGKALPNSPADSTQTMGPSQFVISTRGNTPLVDLKKNSGSVIITNDTTSLEKQPTSVVGNTLVVAGANQSPNLTNSLNVPYSHKPTSSIEQIPTLGKNAPLRNSTNKASAAAWSSTAPGKSFMDHLEQTSGRATMAPPQTSNSSKGWVSSTRQHRPAKKPANIWEDSQASNPNFKYTEVVRCKKERQGLRCHDCPDCKDFYDCMRRSGIEFTQEVDGLMDYGRHRSRFTPPQTPNDFWDMEFADEKRDSTTKAATCKTKS